MSLARLSVLTDALAQNEHLPLTRRGLEAEIDKIELNIFRALPLLHTPAKVFPK